MRVLVVKLTSMGDVLHLMPALTDLKQHYPEVVVDWMVEDSFSELPAWHPAVDKVIPVSTRRWRKLKQSNAKEFFAFLKGLRSTPYDAVIDAQGLMKSAVFARFAKIKPSGKRIGFSGDSIKESPAAWLYQKKVSVAREQHAIQRLRILLASAFDYQLGSSDVDYGLTPPNVEPRNQTVMFFHGTTWATKHLPEALWQELAALANKDGFDVLLAWGNDTEQSRAERLARNHAKIHVLEKQSLAGIAATICSVDGALAVDTGLGHMAASFGVPCVSIYGATNAALTGAHGKHQSLVQSAYECSPCLLKECAKLSDKITEPPCYQATQNNPDLSAAAIWQRLYTQIN